MRYIDSRHRKRDLEGLVNRIFDIKAASEAPVDLNEGDGESAKQDSVDKESNIGDDQESIKHEESRPAEDEEMKENNESESGQLPGEEKKAVVTLDIIDD